MIRTLKSFDIRGKNILLRVDFNVPMHEYKVTNTFRIKAALPTINNCLESGASITIMSHLGRPNGSPSKKIKLDASGRGVSKTS